MGGMGRMGQMADGKWQMVKGAATQRQFTMVNNLL
jgi:hypothetical protein